MSVTVTVTVYTEDAEGVPPNDEVEREVIWALKQSPRLGAVTQQSHGLTATWRDVASRTKAQRALNLFMEGDIHEPWQSAFVVTEWDDGSMAVFNDGSSLWIPVDGPAEVRNR